MKQKFHLSDKIYQRRLTRAMVLGGLLLILPLRVWAQPSADFSADMTSVCIGSGVTFNDATTNITGSATYSWNFGPGASPSTALTAGPHTVTYATVGTFTVTLTVTDDAGQDTETKTDYITVIPNASITSVSGSTPLCIGATATYTTSGEVLGGGTGEWSSSNTAAATVNPSTGLVTAVSAGATNIIYTITGGCNGPVSAQQPLTVTPNSAVASVSGTTPLCIGATATYTTSGEVLGGGTGEWSSSNTAAATVNPSTGLVTAVSAGATNIIYTITGGCNGPVSAQQAVIIAATPSAPIVSTSIPTNVCPTLTVNLVTLVTSTTPTGGAILYKTTNNPLGSDVSNPAAVMAGTYYIFYISQAGCSSTGTQITVTTMSCPPDVTVTIIVSPNIMHGTTIFDVIVQVTELNLINTSGQITVNIPRDSRWILTDGFVQSLTIIGSTPVNNSIWAYSSDAINHIFTTSGVITAASYSRFGFRVTFSPGSANGSTPVTSQLVSGSGGEIKVNNNADSEKIDFFHQ